MGKGEMIPALETGGWFSLWPERAGGIPPESGGNAALMWEMHGELLLWILNLRREDYEDECR